MRLTDLCLAALLVAGLAAGLATLGRGTALSGLVRVVDGDTLAIGERRLRLVGMDAPELGQLCRDRVRAYPCGEESRAALRALTHGQVLSCVVHGLDRYGRDLARCEAAGRDVGEYMVARGLAVSDGLYRREEDAARLAGLGLWAGPFDRPAEWRRAHPRPAVMTDDAAGQEGAARRPGAGR